ncbi:hypothetical protein F0562_022698 [Nyssa sinensis]|uniref:Uncharacterized protein n=1 Tax=Nyssa sinensis TaxID=561372 RepID=A0A5J5BG05_9ASTE|nr:hypothetical protein F0562_022698 [Nyssa sinensis]
MDRVVAVFQFLSFNFKEPSSSQLSLPRSVNFANVRRLRKLQRWIRKSWGILSDLTIHYNTIQDLVLKRYRKWRSLAHCLFTLTKEHLHSSMRSRKL